MKNCKDCKDCAYYEGDEDEEWACCKMHSFLVRPEFEPCEKFRLKEQPKEEVGRP